MAKAKNKERGKVKLTEKDISREGSIALNNLSDVLHGTSLKNVQDATDILKAECGEDAEVTFNYDYHYGESDVTIRWDRPETDEEWAKRLERNKNIAVGQRKKRATDKKKKEIAERAELARLQEKYEGE